MVVHARRLLRPVETGPLSAADGDLFRERPGSWPRARDPDRVPGVQLNNRLADAICRLHGKARYVRRGHSPSICGWPHAGDWDVMRGRIAA